MYQEPEPMKEIHAIREKLYEENKSLSHREHIVKIHKEAEDAIKKYGIKVKRASHV
jgi:hypothetical protein